MRVPRTGDELAAQLALRLGVDDRVEGLVRDVSLGFIEPTLRFKGQPGEQWAMFFFDPFGSPLEIKSLKSLEPVYEA